MLKKQNFCPFAFFSIVLLTLFISKPDSSKDLTIVMIFSITLFEFINAVSKPRIFISIETFVADVVAVIPNGIKNLLANDVSRIFINSKLVCGNGTRVIPRDTPDCAILDI